MNTILVATDGSDSASSALDVAIELAQDTGARIVCVGIDDSLAREGLSEAPQEAAETAAQRARDVGVPATTATRTGSPTEQIILAADEAEADLIVVGSRGRGPLTAAVLGSVSRGVATHSRRPVTIVRS
jgi:nucleotide-binding universal stress UspA family protein